MSIESAEQMPVTSDEQNDKPSKLIKRYSNRKLYDTARSKYVTLDEISRMIKAGEEVTIIDNETKEDLTSVTLTQIMYEEEKKESRMPLGMLRDMIQTGGSTIQEFFDRSVRTPVVEMRDNAQTKVETSVEELRQSAVQFRDVARGSFTELTDSARRFFSREERQAEEFKKQSLTAADELQALLEQRLNKLRSQHIEPVESAEGHVEQSVDSSPLIERHRHTEEHVALLRAKLSELSQLVDALEESSRTASIPTGPTPASED